MTELKPEGKNVLSFLSTSRLFSEGELILVSGAFERIKSCINHYEKLVEDGLLCELLEPGSSDWVKGKLKLKISLELIEDESERLVQSVDSLESKISDLDSIRQMQ